MPTSAEPNSVLGRYLLSRKCEIEHGKPLEEMSSADLEVLAGRFEEHAAREEAWSLSDHPDFASGALGHARYMRAWAAYVRELAEERR